MESIDKALAAIRKDYHAGMNRTTANLFTAFDMEGCVNLREVLEEVFDAIETEIDERYMELPLDADGIPIHCGERIISETGREGDVWLIGVFDLMTSDHICHDHTKAHHVSKRTLEDVLQSAGVSVAAIEDVAAEIRELLGVEQ